MSAFPRRRNRHEESDHAAALMTWAATRRRMWPVLDWLHHIPAGGARGKITAIIMKREGVRRGIWDYSLPVVAGGYQGLILELKKPDLAGHRLGGLTKEQVDYGRFQHAQRRCCVVAHGWQPAAKAIELYLAGKHAELSAHVPAYISGEVVEP